MYLIEMQPGADEAERQITIHPKKKKENERGKCGQICLSKKKYTTWPGKRPSYQRKGVLVLVRFTPEVFWIAMVFAQN